MYVYKIFITCIRVSYLYMYWYLYKSNILVKEYHTYICVHTCIKASYLYNSILLV